MTDDFEAQANAARAAIGKPPVGKYSDIPRLTPLWAAFLTAHEHDREFWHTIRHIEIMVQP